MNATAVRVLRRLLRLVLLLKFAHGLLHQLRHKCAIALGERHRADGLAALQPLKLDVQQVTLLVVAMDVSCTAA